MIVRHMRLRLVLSSLAGVGLLLSACQPQAQTSPTAAPTKPAAPAASPAAKTAASPSPSPAAVASPSPAAVPSPAVPSPAALASPAASPSPSPAAGMNVTAQLRNPAGAAVGTALLSEEGSGIRMLVQVTDLPAGPHGIHVHEVGRCDPPDFMSAGAHFNPTNRQHGLQNPAGPHAGDLPNLEIGANGTGQLNAVNTNLSLAAGPNSVFDADGSAVVIHTQADDQVTDPSGNSGGRIACGVITRP